jgi:hypothetical protein
MATNASASASGKASSRDEPFGNWIHSPGFLLSLALLVLAIPVVYAYIVPAVGTNVLRVWEFNTRLRLGRFRPHHGFVFGSATAVLMLPALGTPTTHPTLADIAASGLLAAVILGVANWLYDVAAIRAGILKVYNQPWAEGRQASAIVNDYAPWFFGGFGLVQGAGLKFAEGMLLPAGGVVPSIMIGLTLLAATVTLPTLGYVLQSYLRHGHHGCRPVSPQAGE